jgi:hypothetical protein
MVDLKMTQAEHPQQQRRGKRPLPKPVGLRVVPKNENIRKYIKHPSGISFRPQGGVEWPNDRFTQRRLADGDVTLEERRAEQPKLEEAKPAEESKSEESKHEESKARSPLGPRR